MILQEIADNWPELGKDEQFRLMAELPNTLVHLSCCNEMVGGQCVSWPGAKYYSFRLPDIDYAQLPVIAQKTPPVIEKKMPPEKKLPLGPPSIRIPETGGSTPIP